MVSRMVTGPAGKSAGKLAHIGSTGSVNLTLVTGWAARTAASSAASVASVVAVIPPVPCVSRPGNRPPSDGPIVPSAAAARGVQPCPCTRS